MTSNLLFGLAELSPFLNELIELRKEVISGSNSDETGKKINFLKGVIQSYNNNFKKKEESKNGKKTEKPEKPEKKEEHDPDEKILIKNEHIQIPIKNKQLADLYDKCDRELNGIMRSRGIKIDR